ncbi:hypothetical protein EMIT0P218_80013 [Pseudomonas sp. IT-P218]
MYLSSGIETPYYGGLMMFSLTARPKLGTRNAPLSLTYKRGHCAHQNGEPAWTLTRMQWVTGRSRT